MNPRERKNAIEALLKGINVKAKGGTATDSDVRQGHTLLVELAEVKAKIGKMDESAKLLGDIAALDPEGTGTAETEGYLRNFAKQLSSGIERKIKDAGRPYDVKSLLTEGSVEVGVQLFGASYIADPAPITSLFSTTPTEEVKQEVYSYIKQVTRLNNADAVARGDVKPTSQYMWERVQGELKVVAHVTDPIDEYWLKDHPNFKRWVRSEMVYGLMEAFERQMLSGDGVGANMTGLLNSSGIQVQAFGASLLGTIRSAITKLELLGFVPNQILMHPTDWEEVETTTTTTGEFLLQNGGPVDRTSRRLWGVPVVLSVGLTPAEALVSAEGSFGLALDPVFEFELARVGDDFERNQIRARCESRADLMVLNPAGIVKVTLAGA